ncbi:MAG: hypothetical protein FWF52_00285 [Candidatus Azobacteroides sp.]|nr:hypothetical protein [Candidatus Azobacteroides sp.]
MNEKTIIKPDDIRKVRAIAENITDSKRIEPYIHEAEILDVMPAIGVSLYKQIVDNNFYDFLTTNGNVQIVTNNGVKILTQKKWDKFLNGGYYTCSDGACNSDNTRYSAGLIAAISYLAYARMLPNQPLNVTAFGVVQKTTTLSEPIDEKTLFRAVNETRKIGLEYLRQSTDHLRCEGFIDDCKKANAKRYRKFKAIG